MSVRYVVDKRYTDNDGLGAGRTQASQGSSSEIERFGDKDVITVLYL